MQQDNEPTQQSTGDLAKRIERERGFAVGPDGEDDTAHLNGVVHPHQLLGGSPWLRLVPNTGLHSVSDEPSAGVDLEGYYRAIGVTDGGESFSAARHGVTPDDEIQACWRVTPNGPVRLVSDGEACGRIDGPTKASPIRGA